MTKLETILSKAIAALNNAGIKYVIVGGFAAILRGSARTTTDLDIILQDRPNLADKLIQSFKDVGFDVMEQQLRLAIKEGHNSSIFFSNSVLRLDIKVAKNQDEKEVIEQSVKEEYKGVQIQLASIEQILYGKILYLGDISDLSDDEILDFTDAKDFVNVYNSVASIDISWLESKVKKIGLFETYSRLIKKSSSLALK